ncbi:MAG TPA: hypothetical protein VFX59_28880 [Polyangiales bacterium]|nr:hypothetical protein [Polyangiales bacterium]
MEDLSVPINEDRAGEFLDTITDPVVRNLVGMAFANVRLELGTGNLPDAPFDVNYFVRLVHMTLKRTDVVRAILDGQSIAAATGWDI